ncbi:MAG: nucleotidyltransferase family protein [Alphaproteobacteria bacterium]|nr:nucleotidyltransferase family protein [Alphaproteobacteria bacterium]
MSRPRAAMLLAAGLGTRMRPLTAHTAKPLLALGGRTLLDHALDRLAAAGVETVVVNIHWHAEQVADHLATHWADGPRIVLRRERELLDTGGAVRAALDVLGAAPFFVVNGDAFWLDGPTPALSRLADAWKQAERDAVLLVHPTYLVPGGADGGDFFVDPLGRVRRPRPHEVAPFRYAGIQLIRPALFAAAPAGRFSINPLWDRAIEAGRLAAVVHDGSWFHLSTPPDLADAESNLQARALGEAE